MNGLKFALFSVPDRHLVTPSTPNHLPRHLAVCCFCFWHAIANYLKQKFVAETLRLSACWALQVNTVSECSSQMSYCCVPCMGFLCVYTLAFLQRISYNSHFPVLILVTARSLQEAYKRMIFIIIFKWCINVVCLVINRKIYIYIYIYTHTFIEVKVKVKQSRYRTGVAQRHLGS